LFAAIATAMVLFIFVQFILLPLISGKPTRLVDE
jgi:hypothetical protein